MPDPAALNQAFAEEVRVLLTRRKVSQQALQDAFGWSRAKVNRLVNAKQEWGMSEMLAVCDYLDVDLTVLLSTAKAAALEQTAAAAQESVLTDEERAFAVEIQAERIAQGFTPAELAKRARLRESTIERIEAGAMQADSEQLLKICRALGISIAELAQRAETRLASERRPQRGQQASSD